MKIGPVGPKPSFSPLKPSFQSTTDKRSDQARLSIRAGDSSSQGKPQVDPRAEIVAEIIRAKQDATTQPYNRFAKQVKEDSPANADSVPQIKVPKPTVSLADSEPAPADPALSPADNDGDADDSGKIKTSAVLEEGDRRFVSEEV